MDNRDKIIQIVKMKGPLLPAQINKELNTNVLFASAMLSEMVDKKIIRLSNLKVGGSPLYYAPGQEYKLQNFADKLGGKEKRAYDILKDNRVLRDIQLEPVVRQALRLIPDFAKPVEINHKDEKILFWKWYLITDDQLEKLIKNNLGIVEKQISLEEEPGETKNKTKKEPNKEEKTEKKPEEPKPEATPEPKAEDMDEKRKYLDERERILKQKETEINSRIKQAEQKKSLQDDKKPKEFPLKDIEEPDNEFFRKVKRYFEKNSIVINNFKVIRKNFDIEFDISIPSQVGKLNYFCKAKNKKKCNDGDLSAAFIQGQAKKLPILLLTTGDITKKAETMLASEFKSMTVRTI